MRQYNYASELCEDLKSGKIKVGEVFVLDEGDKDFNKLMAEMQAQLILQEIHYQTIIKPNLEKEAQQ